MINNGKFFGYARLTIDKEWGREYNEPVSPSHEDLKVGALLRIAASLESIKNKMDWYLSSTELIKKRQNTIERAFRKFKNEIREAEEK